MQQILDFCKQIVKRAFKETKPSGVHEDTGGEYRDFFICEGRRYSDEEVKYFVPVDDIEIYYIQGYWGGSCAPGQESDAAFAMVTRAEMTVGDRLKEIYKLRYDAIITNDFVGDNNRYLDKRISFEMYYQTVVKHFSAYSLIAPR